MRLHVITKTLRAEEGFSTGVTSIRLLPTVDPGMVVVVRFGSESFVTKVAGVGSHVIVDPHME
jgi:hypothetical protein